MVFLKTACSERDAGPQDGGDTLRKAVMVRVPADLLTRIDRAAKRFGLSRAAFMLAATAERVEKMEQG